MNLNVHAKRGVTWTSWGGKAVQISATLQTTEGEEIWRSAIYKRSPNGSNGFNSASAVINKLMKDLQKKFR